MTNPKESAEDKPSSSKQQAKEDTNPQNAPVIQERTRQNESNMTDQSEKSDEGDNNVKSQGGEQEKTGQNKINTTQTEGDAKEEGSGGGNAKGQSGGDIDHKGTPSNVENEKNVTETEKGEETGASASAAGSSASISGRKRGTKGDSNHPGSSSGSNSKARKKAEMEIPSCAPTCYVCKRTFASWKAVFGHLKAHRRQFPGAFPPPTFTPSRPPEKNNNGDNALKEQLAPTLLNLACETTQKMSEESHARVSAGAASSSRRGLDIDIKEPRTSFLFDLNQPPPPEKDDDDDDDGDKN